MSDADAWSRIELGFDNYVNVNTNTNNAIIEAVENGGSIYRLWSSGFIGQEYYLVENRQKTGYDAYLPGSGLLIWHIDEGQLASMNPNDDEWYPGYTANGHYGVALEQADGQFHQEKLINSGDSGDPYPGTSANFTFSPLSIPDSDDYNGGNTYVVIDNISPSASLMTADLQVSFLSDIEEDDENLLPDNIYISQNYPNPFNPATNILLEAAVSGRVEVTVYDILGRVVTRLFDNYVNAGQDVALTWDGCDAKGNEVGSGIYFYEVITDQGKEVKKMTLMK